MESILVALLALLVVIGLIIGGTRFSLYLFLLKTESTHRFTQRMPYTEERISQDIEYGVERSLYHETVNTSSSSSARYARSSLMVVAFFLLLAIMATISIVAGLFH